MADLPPIKHCTKCGEDKPREMFAKDKRAKDGIQQHCKACNQAYRKCNPDAIKAYKHSWYVDNAEHVKQKNRNRYAANPAAKRNYDRTYYAQNREGILEYERAKRRANPELYRQRGRAYYWVNSEKVKARANDYRRANPDRRAISRQKRRALIKNSPGTFTLKDLEHIQAMQQEHCAYCSRLGQTLTIEHITPLTRGGHHSPENICLACPRCNFSKHDKTLEEWLAAGPWYLRDNE